MLAIKLLLVLISQLSEPALAKQPAETADVIRGFRRLFEHSRADACFLAQDEAGQDMRLRFEIDPFITQGCLANVEARCAQFAKLCRDRYSNLCSSYDAEAMQLRLNDSALRSKILSHAERFFRETVKDPAVQSRCCGDNQACKSRIDSALLFVAKAAVSTKDIAFATSTQVTVAELSLMRFQTSAALERGLLHEIGHLCQLARRGENVYPAIELTKQDFKSVWGEEISRCVFDELDRAAASISPAVNKQAWSAEAFAEVFSALTYPQKNALPDFWHGVCASGVDSHHGPVRRIVACVLKLRPGSMNALCNRD